MAASEIISQECTSAGLEVTFESANADGNYFTNNGRKVLRVKNGGGADITITVDSPTECDQGFTHDVEVTVTASEERDIGPFKTTRFNDSNGRVNITYSGVTSVTVAVIEYVP